MISLTENRLTAERRRSSETYLAATTSSHAPYPIYGHYFERTSPKLSAMILCSIPRWWKAFAEFPSEEKANYSPSRRSITKPLGLSSEPRPLDHELSQGNAVSTDYENARLRVLWLPRHLCPARGIGECAKHKSGVFPFRQEPEEHRDGNDREPIRQGAQIVCPARLRHRCRGKAKSGSVAPHTLGRQMPVPFLFTRCKTVRPKARGVHP